MYPFAGKWYDNIIFKKGITKINPYTLVNTFAENDTKLPSTLKRINKYAFSTACKNMVIPNGCEYIDLSGTKVDVGKK